MRLQLFDIKVEEKRPVIISIQFDKTAIKFLGRDKNTNTGRQVHAHVQWYR